MIMLDTSILIDILRGNINAKEIENKGRLATCFPVQCELYKGTKIARNTEKGEEQVGKMLERLETLNAGKDAARKFSQLQQKYTKIPEFDLMIAAICISNNSKLISQDTDFKQIEELESEIYN